MRQAYCILAHGSFNLLRKLIEQLDDDETDIYIHVDKKSGNIDSMNFESLCSRSKVYVLKNRINSKWGDVSFIRATLQLLRFANRGGCDYYHIISGVDFPLKSPMYIKQFLESNNGKEFIGFTNASDEELAHKCGLYHFFSAYSIAKWKFIRALNSIITHLQLLLCIENIDYKKLKKGCNWCSITHSLATDLINNESYFLRKYRYTSCADEIFIQTFVWNNKSKYKIYNETDEYLGCMRYIDWKRGNPYVWKTEDFNQLIKSPFLFARKFSESDMTIINKLTEYLRA